eukprot:CAMPEP_0173415954 /NCGR_PEP_ID=MMETSP1356-20130122/85132_1 /TAXON_ID=77927 ORGANISM="Hemiselmis virescens, Strain PCC157" /NCGR_SAMPLE_ID=MMETSP1356 /ASSEMBLY_ACC=CAM_ASM_000847 /LENGTH=223 /DNA_ID=CAMNT_0014378243 /DNA_START=115 /DNA_END=784 /DNA_ORIENTATION=+
MHLGVARLGPADVAPQGAYQGAYGDGHQYQAPREGASDSDAGLLVDCFVSPGDARDGWRSAGMELVLRIDDHEAAIIDVHGRSASSRPDAAVIVRDHEARRVSGPAGGVEIDGLDPGGLHSDAAVVVRDHEARRVSGPAGGVEITGKPSYYAPSGHTHDYYNDITNKREFSGTYTGTYFAAGTYSFTIIITQFQSFGGNSARVVQVVFSNPSGDFGDGTLSMG